MSVVTAQPINMSSVKELFGNLSLSNYYFANFNSLTTVDGTSSLSDHLQKYSNGVKTDWILRNAGILCTDANLPSSTFATAEVKDNFIGIPQEFAHSRLFTDIDFTFYVDKEYYILQFFEAWMDFISGSGAAQVEIDGFNKGYFRRFQYPDSYKINSLSISKFERSLGSAERSSKLDYQFVNAFPKGITSIPVSYGQADLLKVTVTFNYDRYVVSRSDIEGKVASIASDTDADISKYVTQSSIDDLERQIFITQFGYDPGY
jgi:hypothetical protein